MKGLFRITFLLLAAFAVSSCSSDDDAEIIGGTGPYFKLKGESYDMSVAQPNATIGIHTTDGAVTIAEISLSGVKDSKVGHITFNLSYLEANGISGTYTSGQGGQAGYYDSSSSSFTIVEGIDDTQETHSGGAEGNFKITHNSGNSYSVEFNVTYDDGTQAEGNFTHNFTVQ